MVRETVLQGHSGKHLDLQQLRIGVSIVNGTLNAFEQAQLLKIKDFAALASPVLFPLPFCY